MKNQTEKQITEIEVNDYLAHLTHESGITVRWNWLNEEEFLNDEAERCIELVRVDDQKVFGNKVGDEQLVVWVTPENGSFSGIPANEVEFTGTPNTYSVACYLGEDLWTGSAYSVRSCDTLEQVAHEAMTFLLLGGK